MGGFLAGTHGLGRVLARSSPLEITWLSRNFGHDLWMWIREQSLELHVLLMSSPLSAIRPEAKCLLYI